MTLVAQLDLDMPELCAFEVSTRFRPYFSPQGHYYTSLGFSRGGTGRFGTPRHGTPASAVSQPPLNQGVHRGIQGYTGVYTLPGPLYTPVFGCFRLLTAYDQHRGGKGSRPVGWECTPLLVFGKTNHATASNGKEKTRENSRKRAKTSKRAP